MWKCSTTGNEAGSHLFGRCAWATSHGGLMFYTCMPHQWLFHVSMPCSSIPWCPTFVLTWHVCWSVFTSVFLLAWNANSMAISRPDMTARNSIVSICFVRPSANMVFVSHHRTFVVPSAGTLSFIIGSPNSSHARQLVPHRSIANLLSWTSPPELCSKWSCKDLQSVNLWSLIASFESICHAEDLGSWGPRSPCRTIRRCSASSYPVSILSDSACKVERQTLRITLFFHSSRWMCPRPEVITSGPPTARSRPDCDR